VDLAILLGADPDTARKDLREALEFEIKLANVSCTVVEAQFKKLCVQNTNYFLD